MCRLSRENEAHSYLNPASQSHSYGQPANLVIKQVYSVLIKFRTHSHASLITNQVVILISCNVLETYDSHIFPPEQPLIPFYFKYWFSRGKARGKEQGCARRSLVIYRVAS